MLEKQSQKSLVHMWVKPVHYQKIQSDKLLDSTSSEFSLMDFCQTGTLSNFSL